MLRYTGILVWAYRYAVPRAPYRSIPIYRYIVTPLVGNQMLFLNFSHAKAHTILYLIVSTGYIWYVHIVCGRTNVFILFTSEYIETNKMNLKTETKKFQHLSRINTRNPVYWVPLIRDVCWPGFKAWSLQTSEEDGCHHLHPPPTPLKFVCVEA